MGLVIIIKNNDLLSKKIQNIDKIYFYKII